MGLRAVRFRNQPVLEACAAGQHRMLPPEQGPAVKRVQQALIDAGYPLPLRGADGVFGDETAAAVARYKREHGIEPSDGVVGPKTMQSLDARFADEVEPLPPETLATGELYAEEVLDLVREVEAGYPADTPEQVLTRIRQLYYPGTDPVELTKREWSFDQLLPDAPLFEADGFTRRLVRPGPVSSTTFARLTGAAYENNRPPRAPDNPGPYLVDPLGARADLGHVLLVVDALTHDRVAHPYSAYGIPAIDPASWVADLAFAAVWAERDGLGAPFRLPLLGTEPDIVGYYEQSAPPPDLFGDVDGYGLLEQWKSVGGPLSGAIEAYYLAGTAAESPGCRRRMRHFATAVLGGASVDGRDVSWNGATRAAWLVRVNRVCDLVDQGMGALITTVPPGSWRFAPFVLDRFLAWARDRFADEHDRDG